MCNRACGLRLIPEFTGCQADAKVLCSAGQRIPHKGVWRPLAHFQVVTVSQSQGNSETKIRNRSWCAEFLLDDILAERSSHCTTWQWGSLILKDNTDIELQRSGANCLVLHLSPQNVMEIVTVRHSEWHHHCSCRSLLDTSTVLMSLIPKCCFLVVLGTPLGLGWGR